MLSLADKIQTITLEPTPEGFIRFVDKMEKYALDSEFSEDKGSALQFYTYLNEVMNKYGNSVKDTDEYARLNNILLQLKWLAFSALDKINKQQLLSEGIIYALKNNIDVLGSLEYYFFSIEFGSESDNQERQLLTYSLTRNNERLGSDTLQAKTGENWPPYIANWIRDFLSYVDPQWSRGQSYELAQYLYTSPNPKKLSPENKQILSQIIGIYNYLRHFDNLTEIKSPRVVKPLPISKLVTVPQSPLKPQGANPLVDQLKPKPSPISPQVTKPSPVVTTVPLQPGVKMTVEEIKREMATKELPAGAAPSPAKSSLPSVPAPVSRPAGRGNVGAIQTIDDLKKIDLPYLRTGQLQSQISSLRSVIFNLARVNHVLPYYVVISFEQSPLFKSYIMHGTAKVLGSGSLGDLTQTEFEAMADLRKEIERL